MSDQMAKLTPYKDGARRRMFMKALTNVAILPGGRGANPEANVTFFKSADGQDAEKQGRRKRKKKDGSYEKQTGPREGENFESFLARMMEEDSTMTRARARRMFNGDTEKAGDLVDLATSSDAGHQHGIHVYMYDDEIAIVTSYAMGEDSDRSHDHQLVRNADGSYSVLENAGHTHDDIPADAIMNIITQRLLEKEAAGEELPEEGPLADLLAAAKKSKDQQSEGEPEMADDNKELDALKAQVAALTAVAALTGAHKAHYDTLDEDGQAEFLKMDDAAKTRAVEAAEKAAKAKAEEADPVVYTADNGDVFKQSDDPRLVKMAKERDAERKENIRLQKAAEDEALTKRAEELKFIPGDVDVRKAMLKALDGIEDEGVRKKAHEAIKAVNRDNSPLFKTVGAGGTPTFKADTVAEAEAELDRLAKERAAKEGEDFYTAYEKVSDANPDLLKKAMG